MMRGHHGRSAQSPHTEKNLATPLRSDAVKLPFPSLMHCIANVYIQNYHIDDEITIISVHIWFFSSLICGTLSKPTWQRKRPNSTFAPTNDAHHFLFQLSHVTLSAHAPCSVASPGNTWPNISADGGDRKGATTLDLWGRNGEFSDNIRCYRGQPLARIWNGHEQHRQTYKQRDTERDRGRERWSHNQPHTHTQT